MTRRSLSKFVDAVLGREQVPEEPGVLLAEQELKCSTEQFTVQAVAMRKSVLARMHNITNEQIKVQVEAVRATSDGVSERVKFT